MSLNQINSEAFVFGSKEYKQHLNLNVEDVELPLNISKKIEAFSNFCVAQGITRKPIVALISPELSSLQIVTAVTKTGLFEKKEIALSMESMNREELNQPGVKALPKPYWVIMMNGTIGGKLKSQTHANLAKQIKLDGKEGRLPTRGEAIICIFADFILSQGSNSPFKKDATNTLDNLAIGGISRKGISITQSMQINSIGVSPLVNLQNYSTT